MVRPDRNIKLLKHNSFILYSQCKPKQSYTVVSPLKSIGLEE